MNSHAPVTSVLAVLALAMLDGANAEARGTLRQDPFPIPAESALVQVVDRADEGVLELIVGPAELPAAGPNVRLPIQLVSLPVDGWLHGFEWEITDPDGRKLPDGLLHHFNLIDPDRRELFAPVALRVAAGGRETAAQEMPRILGYGVRPDTRWLVAAMFASPRHLPPGDRRDYGEVYLRVRLFYSSTEDVLGAPLGVYPFHLDVMGLVGPRAFPLQPGRTVRSWEGRPAIDGTVLALGAHLHNYAEFIRLEDVTTGEIIWQLKPTRDANGRVHGVPTATFWASGGLPLRNDRTYRVVVAYDNPTDETLPYPDAGMGEMGGIFVPAEGSRWPALDRQAEAYVVDLNNTLECPVRPGC